MDERPDPNGGGREPFGNRDVERKQEKKRCNKEKRGGPRRKANRGSGTRIRGEWGDLLVASRTPLVMGAGTGGGPFPQRGEGRLSIYTVLTKVTISICLGERTVGSEAGHHGLGAP